MEKYMPRKTFKKITTTPELINSINYKNKLLMERFLREKNVRSSDKTIVNYRSHLNIFFVWNLQYNSDKFFCDIRKIEFADYFNFVVNDLNWGSARFNGGRSCLSSLSSFTEKFLDDEYPQFRNVILKAVELMPKSPTREKTVLSEDQINGLLKYLSDNNDIQEACWLALATSSGARFSELLRFTTDIIDENNTVFEGIFIETTKKIKTKGRTKTGKLLTKYIIKDLFLSYYDKWLLEREKILLEKDLDHNYIFIKRDGTPAEEHIVRSWITKFENYLGVPFYPHALRHYLTTHLFRIGLPAQLIKELFGWESLEMASLYNDMEAKDMKWNELEKLKEHLNNKQ